MAILSTLKKDNYNFLTQFNLETKGNVGNVLGAKNNINSILGQITAGHSLDSVDYL